MKGIKIRFIVYLLIAIFLVWFFMFRSKEISVTYDSVEAVAINQTYSSGAPMMKSVANRAVYGSAAEKDFGVANVMSNEALYDAKEEAIEASGKTERYRENKFYRVDSESFDYLLEDVNKVIDELKGTIKVNEQNSIKKVVYEKEFYPRLLNLEFTVDNKTANLERVEEVLKKWGNIRVSNSNKTSIEQELVNYEQQLKEMEEARKALQESKDRDWIARQDADLAKRSEQIKHQIENAKKESTYITYTINIYEVIKFKVNAIKYWYSNNFSLKNAVDEALPSMIDMCAKLIPVILMVIILLFAFASIIRGNRRKEFKDRIDILKNEFGEKDIHFDIKM